MARLNEAPVPTESVDALKRRFVRQNRELAKNNSAQCLRIRALECEVSRLLAENLDLREDIVHLQAQLSEPRSRIDNSALVSVKDQLQAKLLEFGTLVSELGRMQDTHPSVPQDKFSDPASWRPEVPAAILSGQAPRMDGIAEEVSSPGGSLQVHRNNIIRLSDHSNPSPDIGPPPIVHFDNEDPIKFDPLCTEADQTDYAEHEDQPTSDNDESLPTKLSVNLETRRKRRDSKVQLRRSSLLPPDLDEDDQPQLTRTSAKRKLSVRDVEDDVEKRVSKDDFKFSRRSSIAADSKNTEPVTAPTNILEETETPALLPERKVLGNKSVNVSPRKLSRSGKGKGDLKKEDGPLKPATKTTDRRKSRNPAKSVSIATTEPETIMRTIEIALPSELTLEDMEDLAPKTPLPEFFSPTPSEPSAARDEGRDTPPPSGLTSMSSGPAALNGASRPSRRARAAVNYAEPNLVSKMRRPTAAKGDAVDANGRRISTNMTGSERKAMRTVIISGNDMTGSLAQEEEAEAASPLGQKVDREHERFETDMMASASGRAISALMAGSRKHEKEAAEDVGIYDLKESSDVEESAAGRKRNSRRHSSIADGSENDLSRQRSSNGPEVQQEADTEERQEEAEVQETVRKAPRSARVDRSGARRRSMMV
ncbi:hypothetical protein E4T52_10124 [Aureobasidium sp. EXF-3400]|nr:hypothetical protein E4T51_13943 [Aureobasidium sp. EXF-12344]KAI4774919.1 hypothetical protein E4T52_10124 [Aureobasidium sp. EXF-3400]